MRKLAQHQDIVDLDKFLKCLDGADISYMSDDSAVWIHNEEDLMPAKNLLHNFNQNPDSEDMVYLRQQAGQKKVSAKRDRHKIINARKEVFGSHSGARLTLYLIVFTCIVSLLQMSVFPLFFRKYFFMSNYYGIFPPEVLEGQVWRLITPVFMHGGLMHLGFNMLWLYSLGSQIETQEKSLRYIILFLILAAFSNYTQYFVAGPAFLGMSGVVYGFLTYIWMMSYYDTKYRYYIDQTTLVIMGVWMLLCVMNIIPGVANGAHVGGALAGAVLGYLRASK